MEWWHVCVRVCIHMYTCKHTWTEYGSSNGNRNDPSRPDNRCVPQTLEWYTTHWKHVLVQIGTHMMKPGVHTKRTCMYRVGKFMRIHEGMHTYIHTKWIVHINYSYSEGKHRWGGGSCWKHRWGLFLFWEFQQKWHECVSIHVYVYVHTGGKTQWTQEIKWAVTPQGSLSGQTDSHEGAEMTSIEVSEEMMLLLRVCSSKMVCMLNIHTHTHTCIHT
jgi:hypothetical protein